MQRQNQDQDRESPTTKYKNAKTITKTVKETVTLTRKGKRALETAAAAEVTEVLAYATRYCLNFDAYSSACGYVVDSEPTTVVIPTPTTTGFVEYIGYCGDQ